MPLTVLPCVNRGLPSLVILRSSDCSRKESLLTGAVSHMQILSSKHAHIHLPVHFIHALQCKDSKTMLRARVLLWEEVKFVMQPGMSMGTDYRKNVSRIPRKRRICSHPATACHIFDSKFSCTRQLSLITNTAVLTIHSFHFH